MEEEQQLPHENRREFDQLDMKQLVIQAIKDASKEWLDEMFRRVGKWSIYGAIAFIATLLLHVYISTHSAGLKQTISKTIDQLSQ